MAKANSFPSELHYNCQSPDFVLRTQVILPSEIHGGISMSDWSELGSHGPFKITFRAAEWFKYFIRVRYWQLPTPSQHLRGSYDEDAYAIDQNADRVSKVMYDSLREHYIARVGESSLGRVWKTVLMFADECEWWCPHGIGFDKLDVVSVTYMTNAPCVLSKIRLNRVIRELKVYHPNLYREAEVNDPYLRGERYVDHV